MHMHMPVRTRAAAGPPARVLALAALALAAAGAARAQNLTDPFGCDVSQGEAYCPGLDACQKPWLDNATALPEGEAANPEPCPGPYHYAQGFVDAAGPPSPDWDAADAEEEEGGAMLTAMPDIARANNDMGLADSRGTDNVQGRGFQGGFNPFRPGPSAWPGGCTPYCTSTGCRPPPGCGGGGGRPPWAGGGGGGGGWTPPDLGLGNCARNGAQTGTKIGEVACAEIARQCGPTLRFQAASGSNDVVLQMICNFVDTSACVGAYEAYLESASCPYSNTPCGQKIAGKYYRFCRV